MRQLKRKSLLIVIIAFISAIVCSQVFLMFCRNSKEVSEPQTKAADLTISNLAQLNDFATEVRSGNHYAGKTVVLDADINCNGNGLYPIGTYTVNDEHWFEGTFDGQGHMIYNVFWGWSNGVRYDGIDCGIFNINKGTIKNTRFLNCSVFSKGNNRNWGIVVGLNYGTIENCIVEDCKFISNGFRTDNYVAPIAAYNGGTVRNCLVRGSYKIGGYSKPLIGNIDGLNAYYFVTEGKAATNCIFTASVEIVTYDKNDGSLCYPPSTADSIGSNFSSCESAHSSMTSFISETAGEDVRVGDNEAAWYKYASTSYGFGGSGTYCVYLRAFVGWETFEFDAGSGGKVTQTKLTVPSDYATISPSGRTLKLYTYSIVAQPLTGYDFDYWSESGKTRTAYFKIKTFEVWFNAGTNTTQTTNNCSLDTHYVVKYNTAITITQSPYTKQGYKRITLSFKDTSNEIRKVTYVAKDKYYIGYYAVAGVNQTGSTSASFTTGGGISVTAYLKSYNITLG